jgi:hypothetical protein
MLALPALSEGLDITDNDEPLREEKGVLRWSQRL